MDNVWKTLENTLEHGWPTFRDFEAGNVVPPPNESAVIDILKEHAGCLVLGQPRMGKTTLIRSAALQLYRRHMFDTIIVIDRADIATESDVRNVIKGGSGFLYIVENWQAKPELENAFTEFISETTKIGAKTILAFTRFPYDDGEEASLPDFSFPKIDADDEMAVQRVAKGMIDKKIEAELSGLGKDTEPLVERAKKAGLHFDERDYDNALVLRSSHRRLPGNLRVLFWRLEAWRPRESNLRDVTEDQLLKAGNTELLRYRDYKSTIFSIAVVAEHGIAYVAGPNENLPGAKSLEIANLIVPVGDGWKMDQTDAHLFVLALLHSVGPWQERVAESLLAYLANRPSQVHALLGAIVAGAIKHTEKRALLCKLLMQPNIRRRETQHWAEQPADSAREFYALKYLVLCLVEKLPNDEQQKQERVGAARELLPDEIAQSVGKAARRGTLQPMAWFLRSLASEPRLFGTFAAKFIEGYDKKWLEVNLENVPYTVKRLLLGQLERLGLGSVAKTLHSVGPKGPEFRPWSQAFKTTLQQLQHATAQSGARRQEIIEFVREVDEDFLDKSFEGSGDRDINRLQNLIQSAIWLSPTQAARIAELVPGLCSRPQRLQTSARNLGFLLGNCWQANPQAADDLLSILVQHRPAELMPSNVAMNLRGLGRWPAVAEKVRPGITSQWWGSEVDYLVQAVAGLDIEEDVDDLLVNLAVFAPGLLEIVLNKLPASTRAKLNRGTPSYGRWPRIGVLNSTGVSPNFVEIDKAESHEGLLSAEPAKLAFGLYGLHCYVSEVAALRSILLRLPAGSASSWIPLLLARYGLPSDNKKVIEWVRTILMSRFNQRTSCLYNLLLACCVMPVIALPANRAPWDNSKHGHRALQAAIHGKIVRLDAASSPGTVKVSLSQDHPFVRLPVQLVSAFLQPLRNRDVSLSEWDGQLPGNLSQQERDWWRGKLLSSEVVGWTFAAQQEFGEVRFHRMESHTASLRKFVDLE